MGRRLASSLPRGFGVRDLGEAWWQSSCSQEIVGDLVRISSRYNSRWTPSSGVLSRKVDARDFDDGFPRSFLAGAIVEVWLKLHLNWA